VIIGVLPAADLVDADVILTGGEIVDADHAAPQGLRVRRAADTGHFEGGGHPVGDEL
jgi:hypothetical protein